MSRSAATHDEILQSKRRRDIKDREVLVRLLDWARSRQDVPRRFALESDRLDRIQDELIGEINELRLDLDTA